MNRVPVKGPFGRLSVQLVVSHVLVGVASLITTTVLVFLLAPRLFEPRFLPRHLSKTNSRHLSRRSRYASDAFTASRATGRSVARVRA